MSDPRRRPGPDDPPPMLRLGEDRPDVEDTTVEQLREQQAELERQRAELAQEAARERDRAQEQLASERRRAQRELAKRQREIDDAERRLLRTERRLRREAARAGHGDVPQVSSRLSRSRRTDNALLNGARAQGAGRGRGRAAVTLAVLAAATLGLGTLLSTDRADEQQVQELIALDTARVDLREAISVLDTELVRHATGDPVALDDEGNLPSVSLAEDALERAGADDSGSFSAVNSVLSSEEDSPVRAATTWQDDRREFSYVVASWDVEDQIETMSPGSGWGTTLLWVGAALLVLTAVVLLRGGSRLAAGFVALAALSSALLIVQDPRLRGWEGSVEAHEEAADRPEDLQDVVEQDLSVLVGLRSLDAYELEDDEYGYWNRHYALDEVADPDGTVADARLALGRTLADDGAAEDEVRAAALELIETADAARAPLEDAAVAARDDVVARASADPPFGQIALGLGLGLLLPAAGLTLDARTRVREEKE